MLGEQVTPRVLLATAIIIAGQVLIVTYSSHKTNNYDARGLMRLYDGAFLVRALSCAAPLSRPVVSAIDFALSRAHRIPSATHHPNESTDVHERAGRGGWGADAPVPKLPETRGGGA